MTVEEWKTLSRDKREELICVVFKSQYLALTRANQNPETDPIILETLRVSTVVGSKIHIDIHAEINL